jgi:hypothetical protein
MPVLGGGSEPVDDETSLAEPALGGWVRSGLYPLLLTGGFGRAAYAAAADNRACASAHSGCHG